MKHLGASTEQWSLPEDTKQVLRERFKKLKNKVTLEVFTKQGENDQFNTITELFTKELAKLSDAIEVHLNTIGDEQSKRYKVTNSPTVLIQPEHYHLGYIGAPFGEEGRSFIEAIILVSNGDSRLSKQSKKRLAALKEKRDVLVFVTLACPYCPGQVLNAFKAAIEHPTYVTAFCVDAPEQMSLADKYHVGAVPHTVINGETLSRGLQQEEQFITELLTLTPVSMPEGEQHIEGEAIEVDAIVVGGGPAGLTAGLYAARSGLKTIILERDTLGGQLSITPVVENWPGFTHIPGKELTDMISTQVRGYVPLMEGEKVQEIKVGKHIEALTSRSRILGKALILATGAAHRKLNVPGEEKLYGRGVSYCATCDGYLYKKKQVIVVGGGNTALTDALYLKALGASVTVVHRSDAFRADTYLQESVNKEGIPILWDTVVKEILGDDHVTGLKVSQVKKHKTKAIKTEGVFIAIGEIPDNSLAQQIGLTLDNQGFITTGKDGRTNIPRIYAAGDITGGVRQIVTAVGEGATAALSAFEDLSHPYWVRKQS